MAISRSQLELASLRGLPLNEGDGVADSSPPGLTLPIWEGKIICVCIKISLECIYN